MRIPAPTFRWTLTLVCLVSIVAGGSVLAQEITVFEDGRYGGKSQSFRSSIPNLLSESWNDVISSVQIASGRWELCKAESFRDCTTVDRDTPDLRILGLNDEISSLRPVREESAGGGERPTGAVHYNRERSEFAVAQIYPALLARDADPEGLLQGTQQVMEGRMEPWVRSVTTSQEFRDRVVDASAEGILGQIYQGLLGRDLDISGRDTYLRQIERREYTDVVLDILRSAEFRARLP